MQSASSSIGTRITVSISYDDNHYTTDTSSNMKIFINQWVIFKKLASDSYDFTFIWFIRDCGLDLYPREEARLSR